MPIRFPAALRGYVATRAEVAISFAFINIVGLTFIFDFCGWQDFALRAAAYPSRKNLPA